MTETAETLKASSAKAEDAIALEEPGNGSTKVSRTLSVGALSNLERRVEELNRRARKLSVPALRVSVSEPRIEERRDEVTGHVSRHEVVDVTIEGETPKLAGWRLAGVLDHDGPEPVLNRVPDVEADLSAYRDAKPFCSHCRTTRRRLETFVVIHEDGRLSQVGRNCLADFLGGASPESLLWLAGWIREASEALDEAETWGESHAEPVAAPLEFLAATAACVRVGGWVSRSRAREQGGAATAQDAWELCFPPRGPSTDQKRWASARQETDADRALATEALAWAQAQSPTDPSDYLSNLGRLARKGWVKGRDAGLMASAVASYSRAVGRERERRAALKSEWFGEVGTRYRKLTLTVIGHSYHESQFGTTTLVRYADAEGRRFKWWASGSQSPTDGDRVVVDATVKGHETWKDVRETMLTRVSECQLDEAAAKAATKAQRALDHAMGHLQAKMPKDSWGMIARDADYDDALSALDVARRAVVDAQAAAESAAYAALQEKGC